MKRIILVVLLCFAGSLSASEENYSYVCIAEEMVGFFFDEQAEKWTSIALPNNSIKDKLLIRPVRDDDKNLYDMPLTSVYGIWLLDGDYLSDFPNAPLIRCEEGFSKHQWLGCGLEFDISFKMNARSLRYMLMTHGSYFISSFESEKDLDIIPFTTQIGSCHKI